MTKARAELEQESGVRVIAACSHRACSAHLGGGSLMLGEVGLQETQMSFPLILLLASSCKSKKWLLTSSSEALVLEMVEIIKDRSRDAMT